MCTAQKCVAEDPDTHSIVLLVKLLSQHGQLTRAGAAQWAQHKGSASNSCSSTVLPALSCAQIFLLLRPETQLMFNLNQLHSCEKDPKCFVGTFPPGAS
jgi:hypothetical protein